jgi:hypothetical protein
MEASIVGCDDQLVHLRSVPCEMRPENIFQIYDEQRLAGEDAALYHNGDMLSALGVHVVSDGLDPIHEAQERDRKDPFLQRIVPLKPNPDHHRTDASPAKELTTGRSVRERARARPRSAQNVENPPLEVAPTQTTVGSSAPLCSGLRRFGFAR